MTSGVKAPGRGHKQAGPSTPDSRLANNETRLFPATVTDKVMARLFPAPSPYAADPEGWVRDKLGEYMWSKQVTSAESVRDNRYTAVRSCHDSGKSWLAARLAAWWLDAHPPGSAFVVSTAPSSTQVEAILWREIGRAHRKGQLGGRLTSGPIPMWKYGDEIVGYGRKPADLKSDEDAATAFQGVHARYVLIIMDEAGGIPMWLWNAVDTLMTNADCRVLAIGNPDNPASQFQKVCKPGSGWNVIHISAFDTPNFTDEWVPEDVAMSLLSVEWVNERKKRWGEGNPLYISKVLGQFPEVADDMLISPVLIAEAQARELVGLERGRYGADIARYGKDETVAYRNRGGVIRLALSHHKANTMETVGKLKQLIEERAGTVPMWVDVIGVGAGVYDRLAEQDLPVHPFGAAEQAHRPDKYINRRAEAYWALRELFEDELIDIDPEDDDLAAQLGNIKWKTNSTGRTQIESKEDMAARGLESPDRADAVMMSCQQEPSVVEVNASRDAEQPKDLTSDLLDKVM